MLQYRHICIMLCCYISVIWVLLSQFLSINHFQNKAKKFRFLQISSLYRTRLKVTVTFHNTYNLFRNWFSHCLVSSNINMNTVQWLVQGLDNSGIVARSPASAIASRPILGHSQLLTQCGGNGRFTKPTTQLSLVPLLRISGDTHPFQNTPSCRAQGKVYVLWWKITYKPFLSSKLLRTENYNPNVLGTGRW